MTYSYNDSTTEQNADGEIMRILHVSDEQIEGYGESE